MVLSAGQVISFSPAGCVRSHERYNHLQTREEVQTWLLFVETWNWLKKDWGTARERGQKTGQGQGQVEESERQMASAGSCSHRVSRCLLIGTSCGMFVPRFRDVDTVERAMAFYLVLLHGTTLPVYTINTHLLDNKYLVYVQEVE